MDTKRNNEILKLYFEGLSYESIGKQYGITKQGVHYVLKTFTRFQEYQQNRKEAALLLQLKKMERLKTALTTKQQEKSIASRFLKQVCELWDFEKNLDLDPDTLPAYSGQVIWLRCPIDGHSWSKKAFEITSIWHNNDTRGCPICAGKLNKRTKQPTLVAKYPEYIKQVWDYNKNAKLGLDPTVLTLASNKKVWFKCPHDGHEWYSRINQTVIQQWSLGKVGCRVCNKAAVKKQKVKSTT